MKTEAIMAIRINAIAYESWITKIVEAHDKISPQVRKKFLSAFPASKKAETSDHTPKNIRQRKSVTDNDTTPSKNNTNGSSNATTTPSP